MSNLRADVIRPGLLAAAVSALRREPGPDDHPARARPGLRASGGRGGHLPVRQHEGGGHWLRGRRAALQPTVPGLRHALRLQARACRPRRPQTKGKVERPFHYVETNLLNGRTFRSLEHLNELTAGGWRRSPTCDSIASRGRRPLTAPCGGTASPDPAAGPTVRPVAGRVSRGRCGGLRRLARNFYSVPWRYIGRRCRCGSPRRN